MAALPEFDPNRAAYVAETIGKVRAELPDDTALIGFAGAPFTLLAYLLEGGGSKDFMAVRAAARRDPAATAAALGHLGRSMRAYLAMQIEAGADVVQLFDSWAGILAPCDYEAYAFPYVQRIIEALKPSGVPFIYFANNGATLLDYSARSGADVIGLDWRINIGDAIQRVGDKAVQGNIDPFSLLLPEKQLRERIKQLLDDARQAKGHIFNLGHGITPEAPIESVEALIEAGIDGLLDLVELLVGPVSDPLAVWADPVPVDVSAFRQEVHRQGKRDVLGVGVAEDEIEDVLVPRKDQIEYEGGNQTRLHLGQHHLHHHVQAASSADDGGFIKSL